MLGKNVAGSLGEDGIASIIFPKRNLEVERVIFNASSSWSSAGYSNLEFSSNPVTTELSSITGYTQHSIFLMNYKRDGQIVKQSPFFCGLNTYHYFNGHYPPIVTSQATPFFSHSTSGISFNELASKNITSMACKYSCLAATSDGLIYMKSYNEYNWTWVSELPTSFVDDDGLSISNVKYSQVVIATTGVSVNYDQQESFLVVTKDTGYVFGFGFANDGLAGFTTPTFNMTPSLVHGIKNIIYLTTGSNVVTAINATGSVFAWGLNTYCGLGDSNQDLRSEIPLAITSYNLGEGDSIKKVSCSDSHCVALSMYGQVFGYGVNSYGESNPASTDMIFYPTNITNYFQQVTNLGDYIVDITTSNYVSLALSNTGKLFTWGDSTKTGREAGQFGELVLGETILQIYTTMSAIFVITTSNHVYSWGVNADAQQCIGLKYSQYPRRVNLPQETTSFVKDFIIAKSCVMALSFDGTSSNVTQWGDCTYGLNTNDTHYQNEIINAPFLIGNNLFENSTISELSCSCNSETAFVKTPSGTVYGWGNGGSFKLDNQATSFLTVPYKQTSFTNITQISGGAEHTLILVGNDTVYGIGMNSYGQLGIGSSGELMVQYVKMVTENVTKDGDSIIQIWAASYSSFLLTSSGKIYGTGSNGDKRILPTIETQFTSLVQIPFNGKVRKMIPSNYPVLLFITFDGGAFYLFNGVNSIAMPPGDDFVIDLDVGQVIYLITKLGNVYTLVLDPRNNDYFDLSVDPNITNPTGLILYATKEQLGGVPYLVSTSENAGSGLILSDGWQCFGRNSTDAMVCSGNGACLDENVCSCKSNYTGSDCSLTTCNGTLSNQANVCSGNGNCTSFNTCQCKNGYGGPLCESNWSCFGINFINGSACSSHGTCVSQDKCVCTNGFYGNKCQFKSCYSGDNEKSFKARLCSKINMLL